MSPGAIAILIGIGLLLWLANRSNAQRPRARPHRSDFDSGGNRGAAPPLDYAANHLGIAEYVDQHCTRERDELVKRVRSVPHGRYPSYAVDDALCSFLREVLPRTSYARHVPARYFRRWVDDGSVPSELRGYARNLHREMKREADEAAAERRTKAQGIYEARLKAAVERISADEAEAISKFLEIAYRKVSRRDEYGDERSEALDKEVRVLVQKVSTKHPTLAMRPRELETYERKNRFRAHKSFEYRDASDLRADVTHALMSFLREEFGRYYSASKASDRTKSGSE